MLLNQETNLKIVSDQFTPEVLGVFWITNEKLSLDLMGFDEFNYLFDGLISQTIYGQKDITIGHANDRSNVFFTKNFDQNLFLVHLESNSDMNSIIDDQIALIQDNQGTSQKKILILNKTQKDWIPELQKRYSKFQFTSLELQ